MAENTLLIALALVFVLEGLLPFVFPELWRRTMLEAVQLSERQLRIMGLASISIGMLLLLIFD
ncbi:DUF2065 domain-containing protein [Thiomicrorhabdus cannonii]|uniref:DUF2065 domain-containing protein n=1 Tax=Thiomicrorhabdus cannonii TaxID=2748011 RepID=UPI0015B838E6|nr:DUF2065 domain-containing protein [Thiomicrorhabdus cannonii]